MLKTIRRYREALRIIHARARTEQVQGAVTGAWDVELAFDGLTPDRREQLVQAFAAKTGKPPGTARSDGWLRMSGTVAGHSLGVACRTALAEFSKQLRSVGLDFAETRDGEFALTATPNTSARGSARRVNRRGKLAYVAGVTAAEAFDEAVREQHGPRSYRVTYTVPVAGLNGAQRMFQMLSDWAEDPLVDVPEQPLALTGPDVRFSCQAERMGSGFGALLVTVMHMSRLLDVAPASTLLTVRARPVTGV